MIAFSSFSIDFAEVYPLVLVKVIRHVQSVSLNNCVAQLACVNMCLYMPTVFEDVCSVRKRQKRSYKNNCERKNIWLRSFGMLPTSN